MSIRFFRRRRRQRTRQVAGQLTLPFRASRTWRGPIGWVGRYSSVSLGNLLALDGSYCELLSVMVVRTRAAVCSSMRRLIRHIMS